MSGSNFLRCEGWVEQLSEPGVSIYQCEFSIPDYQDDLFDSLQVPWSSKIDRAVDKRKAEFLAGRYCAKKALAAFDVQHFTVTADKNRCPLWPQGIKGAITHSNSVAMVALTKREDVLGIGIDIENIMTDKTMDSVKDAIVKGAEHGFLNSGQFSANCAVSLIFSIKESFFKAAYPTTNRYFDFDAVEVTKLDSEKAGFELVVKEDLNPQVRPGNIYQGQFVVLGEQVLSLLVI